MTTATDKIFSLDDVQTILSDFFAKNVSAQQGSGATQYIGARYVPMFADPIDWDKTRVYEPLTIVLYQGNSYTSRQSVPTGIEITNAEFWAETGHYNAQIEQYRTEVNAIKNEMTEVKSKVDKNTLDIESIKNTSDGIGIFGITNTTVQNGKYRYFYSPDGENFYDCGEAPYSRGTFSSASNLFEYNGYVYYCSDDSKNIHRTKDFENWELNIATGFPSPLKDGFLVWAPKLFKDAQGNIKLAVARQYDNATIETGIVGTSTNFRVDIFDCSINADGIEISSNFSTLSLTGTSYIDPFIIYNNNYGYIVAVKNEANSQIEIYNGKTLNELTNVLTIPLVGVEGPTLIENGKNISVYMHGYAVRSISAHVDKDACANPLNQYPNMYFRTAIMTANNPGVFISKPEIHIIKQGIHLEHIGLLINSSIALKYVNKHGFIPNDITPYSDIVTVSGKNGPKIYFLGGEYNRLFSLAESGSVLLGLSDSRLGYAPKDYNLMCATPNGITAKKLADETWTHALTHDQEFLKIYVEQNYLYFEKAPNA